MDVFSDSFFEVTLLQRAGLGKNCINAPLWYLQSMLLGMVVLYPLIRKYPEMMKRVVIPVGSVLLMGFLYQNYTHLRGPSNWLGFTYKGNIRAVAEISIGCMCFFMVQKIQNVSFRKSAEILLSLIKWGGWILIFTYMWFVGGTWKYDVFFVVVLSISIILAFSQKTADKNLYQNRFFVILGKFSFPLYLSHFYFADNLKYVLPMEDLDDSGKLICFIICSFVTSIVVMLFGNYIHKHENEMFAKIRRLFVTAET